MRIGVQRILGGVPIDCHDHHEFVDNQLVLQSVLQFPRTGSSMSPPLHAVMIGGWLFCGLYLAYPVRSSGRMHQVLLFRFYFSVALPALLLTLC